MKNADMPVIPCEVSEQYFFEKGYVGCDSQIPMVRERRFMASGITKREMMAIAAMQGLCAHSGDYHQPEHLAMDAVMFADALLAELERTK